MSSSRLLLALLFVGAALAPVAPASAQTARAYDHVHFSVPDPSGAQAWYMAHLDGIEGESPDRVTFGGMPWTGSGPIPVQLLWARLPEDAPPVQGSPILNLGISVRDVEVKVRELEAAGVRVVRPVGEGWGPWKSAVVEDPWGVHIQLVEDPDLPGFHHVTLRTADVDRTLAWYLDRFGGERVRVGGLDALSYGSMYLFLVQGPDEPFTPGYGINHIAWAAHGMDAMAARLRDRGVRFTTEPRENLNAYGHRVAFLQGPEDVRIEVVEHTQCPFSPPAGSR